MKEIALLVSHEKNTLINRFKLLGAVLETVFCVCVVLTVCETAVDVGWRERKGTYKFF